MIDLVEKFFSGDLSPAEEEALDALLASSPEAADRFAEKAAQAYSRFGLPGPDSHQGSRRSWLSLLLLLALAMGYGWHRYGGFQKALGPAAQTAVSSSSETENQKTTAVPPGIPAKSPSISYGDKLHGIAPVSNLSGEKGARTTPATPSPQATGRKTRSQLKISVQIKRDGPVTVQILDSGGLAVKSLYTGSLRAGTYAFAWDGRMDNGLKAPPGDYRLQTQTGANVQTQEFSILAKGKNK